MDTFNGFILGCVSSFVATAVFERKRIVEWLRANHCYRGPCFRFLNRRKAAVDYISSEFFPTNRKPAKIWIMTSSGGAPDLDIIERVRLCGNEGHNIRLITSHEFHKERIVPLKTPLANLELRLHPQAANTKVAVNVDDGYGLFLVRHGENYEGFVTRDRRVALMLQSLFENFWTDAMAPLPV